MKPGVAHLDVAMQRRPPRPAARYESDRCRSPRLAVGSGSRQSTRPSHAHRLPTFTSDRGSGSPASLISSTKRRSDIARRRGPVRRAAISRYSLSHVLPRRPRSHHSSPSFQSRRRMNRPAAHAVGDSLHLLRLELRTRSADRDAEVGDHPGGRCDREAVHRRGCAAEATGVGGATSHRPAACGRCFRGRLDVDGRLREPGEVVHVGCRRMGQGWRRARRRAVSTMLSCSFE